MLMDESRGSSIPGVNLPAGNEPMEGLSEEPGDDLSGGQKEVLERCLHALTHAKNDSQTLAALLLITRVCPASQLDQVTLRRVFEAVGLNLPARLLVTAIRGDSGSGLPAQELLSLGTALLAALSTDPEMAQHPQMLSTLPMLLGLLSDGPTWTPQKQRTPQTSQQEESGVSAGRCNGTHSDVPQSQPSPSEGAGEESGSQTSPNSAVKLNEALASDCYQVLEAVSVVLGGQERLLTRGAVPALCRAIEQSQTLCSQRGRPLLGLLLSRLGQQAWERHSAQLRGVLEGLSREFCQAKEQQRLELCSELLQFLPPQEGVLESGELRRLVGELWAAVRPLVQSKMSPTQLGPVLVLSACLLDLCGWDCVGPPRFCCLLVNRACVEVRMGLEEPPGTDMTPDLQHCLTACYRIMEAAMEQACNQGPDDSTTQPQTSFAGLSLQQSKQVLGVLEEAFSAIIYYLQQRVDQSLHGNPFVFVTFRCLCAWLAEETSCLKEQVTSLLPFLIGYSRDHLQGGGDLRDLSNWMADMSIAPGSSKDKWTGEHALRYLLPALCHLTAEEEPRKALLSLDTLSLLIGFLSKGWERLQKQEGKAQKRDPALETACSALLNITITEPERVRKDPSFSDLQKLLNEALPLLLHKPRLLVLAANFCTLGLMMGRMKAPPSDLTDPGERRFFSAALRFQLSALSSAQGSLPGPVVAAWEEGWEEVGELWRLSVQALGACFRSRPALTALVREQSWLTNTLAALRTRSARADAPTLEALQEALCALAQMCPACRDEIREELKKGQASCLKDMSQLRRTVSQ
ncbi:neurochondrin isoform X2 [Clupea harengus]|nr:neurochondrin isoform X2 [Clupea harengus]XP_031441638.1 neurochondrin isoform X2 [Clupea harengus]